jgi:hypothetical protein
VGFEWCEECEGCGGVMGVNERRELYCSVGGVVGVGRGVF